MEHDEPPPEERSLIEADECRDPTLEDLIRLCGELNRAGAQYVVVGGFAIIHAGYDRHTCDIDLLVDVSLENVARVIQALKTLPDRAIEGLEPGELAS
ncbi:MAG: hypothetical protein KDM64_09250, partial [Verrucomicrobiae bacterium]|nr:hypothetical protein [Verrucomicrobiae bacterium]